MTKEIYFIITYPRDSEENEKDIYFEKKSIKPKCIFVQCDALKKKYVYKKIFKFTDFYIPHKLKVSWKKGDRTT